MEELIACLFLARELAHRAHLKTSSYAEHVALGDFYPAVGEAADAIAEAWQGRFGKRLDVPFITPEKGETPILDALERHVEWIRVHRYLAAPKDETAIQNLIDEAVGLYLSTIYKLRFLS